MSWPVGTRSQRTRARTDSPERVPKGHFAHLDLPKMGSAVFASPPFNGDVEGDSCERIPSIRGCVIRDEETRGIVEAEG